MPPLNDLSGRKFGYLRVVRRDGRGSPVRWLCECQAPVFDPGHGYSAQEKCGAQVVVRGSWWLTSGRIVSCGCQRPRPTASEIERTMTAWEDMHARCRNPKHPTYQDHGGSGVTVHTRWMSFQNFLDDAGPKPGPDFALIRLGHKGNYEPGNVRWVPVSEANVLRARNRRLRWKGVVRTMAGWSRVTGIPEDTIRDRLRRKWPVEKALATKVRTYTKASP